MLERTFRIGIDAGGTKSCFTVELQDTKQRTAYTGGPLNICSIAEEKARNTLLDVLRTIKEDYGPNCEGIGVGAAGISNPVTAGFYRRTIEMVFPFAKTVVCSDAKAALLGALPTGDGIILIAGTGSVCYGEHNGLTWFSGGGGHILDDVGSGYAIGKEILTAVLYEQDNRKAASVLSRLLAEKTGIKSREDLIAFVYADKTGKKEIAALSEMIVEACERGDRTAINIIQKASGELLCLVKAVYDKLYNHETARLALSGSVLNRNIWVRDEFLMQLSETDLDIIVTDTAEDPSCGVLRIL